MPRLGFILLIFSLFAPVLQVSYSQEQPPLQSPLLALNTVSQDAIYLYDLTNQAYRRLEFGAGAHHVWDFSPDGCRILFTLADGTLPARLYSARLDGSDMQAMVTFSELAPEQWGVWEADWSGTANQIAFTMLRERSRAGELIQETHIAFVSPPNSTPEFYSVTGREFSPQWSPDGQWLVYASYSERAAGANVFATAIPTAEPLAGQTPPPVSLLNEADLWLVSADASIKYQLTNFPTGSVTQPRWSSDSELVSFVYSPSPNNDTLWMISRTEGAFPTQLNYQWVLALDHTWLPDATALIAALRDLRNTPENRLWQIPLIPSAEDADSQFYLPDLDLSHADYPRFSPDGRYLAVRSAYELHLVDLQSQERLVLAETVFGNTPAIWSPASFRSEANCPS